MPRLHICVLLLFLMVLELLFLLHMSKITCFFKKPLGPSTSNMSVSGDDDLEPPKNKGS